MLLQKRCLRWLMALGISLLCGLSMGSASAQVIKLISDDEARLPAAASMSARGVTRGPGVKLLSPEAGKKDGLPLKLSFEPRGSAQIDTASVQVTYLKTPAVDLTPRLKAAIRPEGIDLSAVAMPPGEHPIRVSVKDDEGRLGSAVITLKAQ
jgi:hypothetical protein